MINNNFFAFNHEMHCELLRHYVTQIINLYLFYTYTLCSTQDAGGKIRLKPCKL